MRYLFMCNTKLFVLRSMSKNEPLNNMINSNERNPEST